VTPRRRSALRSFEDETRRFLSNASYAERHPAVADSLDSAFALLATEKLEPEVVVEIGNHLRDAILGAINEVAGDPPPGEDHPILRLRDRVAAEGLAVREGKVVTTVVDLARASLRLDHRLGFARDAEKHGEPAIVWDELRRAAFASAYACYELARLQERLQR
jgi:hypothetical protein